MRNVIRRSLLFLFLVSVFSSLNTELLQAQTCQETACARFTTRATLLNSVEVLLTNLLNSLFLGEEVVLSQSEIQKLFDTDIEMNALVNELMLQTGVSTVADLANQTITTADFISATSNTINDPALLATLGTLSATANAQVSGFVIGDFLEISLLNLDLDNGFIRLSDIIDGAISHAYYSDYQGSTPVAITINGTVLGLGIANDIDAYVRITEPATIACGAEGTRFYSASTRIKLVVDLVDLDKSTVLNALIQSQGLDISALSDLNLSLTQVDLYLEVSRAVGEIISIDKNSNEVIVEATPSVADLYLGSLDDALFFSDNPINPAADLGFANIGTLGFSIANPLSTPLLPLPDIEINNLIQVKSYIDGASTANVEVMTFNGPFPEIQTAGDSRNYLANLLTALLSINFELRFELLGGALSGAVESIVNNTLATLLPPVSTVVADVLADEILGPVLDQLVDPLVKRIVGPIGEADVIIDGLNEFCKVLVSGSVFNDENHNSVFDGGEAGTNETIYAKLINESDNTQAVQAVQVVASTGSYEFMEVPTGSYSIVIDNNSSLSDITPDKPSGWIGTQNADGILSNIDIVKNSIQDINFGLFNGSNLTGISFFDDGNGTSYNGVKDGGEELISGSKIRLTNSDGSQIIDEALTNGSGIFQLWIPHNYNNTELLVTEIKDTGYIDVSGNSGSTAGSYNRENDRVSFTAVSGNTYSGIKFGNAVISTFNPDGQLLALPGTTVLYRHTFTAGSEGTVVFTLNSSSSLNQSSSWSQILYEDSNCNGTIDSNENIIEQKYLVKGEKLCLIAKIFVPAQASYNEVHTFSIDAGFSLTGTTLNGSFEVNDVTTVGEGTSGLRIEKSVDKEEAFPGEMITYMLTYHNYGSEPVTQVSIDDATPAYTVFVTASCDDLPQEITGCNITTPAVGESGEIKWELEGEFSPGRTMIVSFRVLIK